MRFSASQLSCKSAEERILSSSAVDCDPFTTDARILPELKRSKPKHLHDRHSGSLLRVCVNELTNRSLALRNYERDPGIRIFAQLGLHTPRHLPYRASGGAVTSSFKPNLHGEMTTLTTTTMASFVQLTLPNGLQYDQPTSLFIGNEFVPGSGEKFAVVNPVYITARGKSTLR